jgi:hypothetical protein
MYKFTDKCVCLVLTCNKTPYKEKLASNQHIYRQVKHAGFAVCFLYADPTLTQASLTVNENDTYNLTVPTKEEYTNLSVKMHMAYCFFNSLDKNSAAAASLSFLTFYPFQYLSSNLWIRSTLHSSFGNLPSSRATQEEKVYILFSLLLHSSFS